MLHVINSYTDPCFNLALEEFFLKQPPIIDDIVILWRNKPTVVIGRNQNIAEEINQPFITKNHIQIVRRLSGGGAVYHDLGNLNFTFITTPKSNSHSEFARLTLPVIDALSEFEVNAKFTGRNDLAIDDQKFSGNAQYLHHGRLLHHGTLLFDTNLTILSQALSGSKTKFSTHSVPSVRSKVTTIKQHLPQTASLTDFEGILLKSIFAHNNAPYKKYDLTPLDFQTIEALTQRYRDTSWTFGSLPPYNFSSKKTFPGGTIELLLDIQNDIIINCKFYGDFFATGDINELENAMCGTTLTHDAVLKVLTAWLNKYTIHGMETDDLLSCFF
jgi:lipoate-protein ligase A